MLKSADTPYKDWDLRYRRGKKRVVTYVTPAVKSGLKRAAMRQQISVAEALRDAIDDYLNAEPK